VTVFSTPLPQTSSRAPCCAAAVSLADAKPGQTGVVCQTGLEEQDAAMLRAMGLRPKARVRICRAGEPCIIEVLSESGCACRLGLARKLASRVMLAEVCEA